MRRRQLSRNAQTAAAKRARHQNFVRRRVRHRRRLKPAERSGGGAVRGLQQRSATEGPWSRFGTTVHLGVGGFDPRTHHGRNEVGRGTGAALGSHDQLNKLSIEERYGMVKHCRIDKTFLPQQCRVTLAVETLHLRYAVGKALETSQGESKQGQGLRTALARELRDRLEIMR